MDRTIEGFLSSLPLMADLKNDALRKRHWDELMNASVIYRFFFGCWFRSLFLWLLGMGWICAV